MSDKVLLDDQVKIVSSKLNIPSTTVKTVIKNYNRLLIDEVLMGMEVRVGYLLRLVPSTITNNYIATTGYNAYVVSRDTSVPINTVLSILTSYLDLVVDSLKEYKNFDIVGIVNIKSNYDEESGNLSINTNTSRSLTGILKEGQSVRVKFNINLRHLLKSGVC